MQDDGRAFFGDSFVSKFSRSGVAAVATLMTDGYMESDATVTDRLRAVIGDDSCQPAAKPPHIVMVHDESSFDLRDGAGRRGAGRLRRAFPVVRRQAARLHRRGRRRPELVHRIQRAEGLSARSFGRFSYFVTRIATGRVQRGLPQALRRCGYKTMSIYPALGAFMGARTSRPRPACSNSSTPRSSVPARSSRTASTTTGPRS